MNRMEYITSTSNSKIKTIKSLYRKKNREQEGLFIVEGLKIVEEAIDKNYDLDLIVLSSSFMDDFENQDFMEKLFSRDIDLIAVDDRIFKDLADTDNPQGILALANLQAKRLEDFRKKENGFYLILDELQDPGNMGTIIRTADAFGVDAIFLGEGCVDIHNPKVVRATMGSIFRVAIYTIDDFKYFKDLIGEIEVYSTSLSASQDIDQVDFKNAMFIIGNESKGVSAKYESLATELVKIPMLGEAESLNAAVASSVIMYESMRQRKA